MNDDQLIAEAELGAEARRFLEGDLGKCIIGMARQEALLAEKSLGKIDPDDKKGIIALQNHIWRAEHFEEWLLELIDKGKAALEVWKDGQER